MPKLLVAVGPVTVLIKDDRAVMDKDTLKAWKNAASELIAGAVQLIGEEVEPDEEDAEA
jgi:hypothetical protein